MNREMRVKLRRAPFVLVAVAAVALAACGSSGSTVKSKPEAPSAPSTTASPGTTAASAPVVQTADNAKLGSLLVDADGKTLYTLTNAGQAVACPDACAKFWPPLLLPSGATSAVGGAGVSGLGTVSASGGTQVTAGGLPLYRFAADSAAGDANGEGVSSFGGVWHVVKTSGTGGSGTPGSSTPDSTPESTDAPTTTSMGGYGY